MIYPFFSIFIAEQLLDFFFRFLAVFELSIVPSDRTPHTGVGAFCQGHADQPFFPFPA